MHPMHHPGTARSAILSILEEGGFGDKLYEYGSRFVCDPPVTDTDIDFFFYVDEDRQDELHRLLTKWGFKEDIGTNPSGDSRPTHVDGTPDFRFRSYKDGIVNLVTTTSRVFADRHLAATGLCKRLNLLRKEDRISVYQGCLYGRIY